MQNFFETREPHRPLSDGESFRQIVESFVANRTASQKRKSPRFPTAGALGDQYPSHPYPGQLVCLHSGKPPFNGPAEGRSPGSTSSDSANVKDSENLLHSISSIQVIDFSEEGLQIELKCENFFDFLDRPLFVQFHQSRLPVNIHWFKQSGDRLRCGCSFCDAIDREPMIASIVLSLSDELVHFLVNRELGVRGSRPEMVFAFISIFYNLRLKFLEAVANFHEAKIFIQRFVNPKYHIRVDHIVRKFKYSKYYQINESRRLVNDTTFNAVVEAFLQPYHKLGCSLLGTGQDMLFLENDVLNLMMNCLMMPDPLQTRSETMGDSVKPVYELFLHLRNRSPETFGSYEFDRQFHCYSALIGEIVLMRERLIDFLSGIGIEWM